MVKSKVFLVGPFIGSLFWESYYFAPYIIHLKKEHSKKIIVFTRSSRFDLYGVYADIFVPLLLSNDLTQNQYCFTIKDFSTNTYNSLVESYKKQYSTKFDIIDHIYPDISFFYYKLKWQFPRQLMDYDFQPRVYNKEIVKRYVNQDTILLDISAKPLIRNMRNINSLISKYINLVVPEKSSVLGCVIESIKLCRYVIGNLSSNVSKLALLLKTPLIIVNQTCTYDEIHLLNPHNTPVVIAPTVEKGVNIGENYF